MKPILLALALALLALIPAAEAGRAPIRAPAAPAAACVSSPPAAVLVTLCTDTTLVPPNTNPKLTVTVTIGGAPAPDGTPVFVWGSSTYGPVRAWKRAVTTAGRFDWSPVTARAPLNFYAQHNVARGTQTPGLPVAYS